MAEDAGIKKALNIFKLVCYVLVFTVGSFLNILLLLTVTRKRVRHSNTSKSYIHLIQNLAIADLLFLVLTIPFDSAWHETVHFPYGEIMCRILWPFQTAIFQAIVFSYVTLSFHRAYGVKQSLLGQIKSVFSYLFIFLIWIASLITVIPYIVFLKHHTPENATGPSCDESWEKMDHRRGYTVALFLTQYLIPLLVMITLYFVTNKTLDVYNKSTMDPMIARRTDRHHRINQMLILYLLIFAILLLPHQIMWFLLDFGPGGTMSYFFDVLNILYVFTYSITITNPVLFFVYNREFKSDMWYFLRCYFCRSSVPNTTGPDRSDSFSVDGFTLATHVTREPRMDVQSTAANNNSAVEPDIKGKGFTENYSPTSKSSRCPQQRFQPVDDEFTPSKGRYRHHGQEDAAYPTSQYRREEGRGTQYHVDLV